MTISEWITAIDSAHVNNLKNIKNNLDEDIYDTVYSNKNLIEPEISKPERDNFFVQQNLHSDKNLTIKNNRNYELNRKTYTQNVIDKYKSTKRKKTDISYVRTNIPTTALRINFLDKMNKKVINIEKSKNKNENDDEKYAQNEINEKLGENSLFILPYSGILNNPKNDKNKGSSLCSADDIDLYLNTSGPIWDVAYAPNIKNSAPPTAIPPSLSSSSAPSQSLLLNKYLAVGTSRIGYPDKSSDLQTLSGSYGVGDDVMYTMGNKYYFPNLLQIWHISMHKNDENSKKEGDTHASLLYCVGLPLRGPCWKVYTYKYAAV